MSRRNSNIVNPVRFPFSTTLIILLLVSNAFSFIMGTAYGKRNPAQNCLVCHSHNGGFK